MQRASPSPFPFGQGCPSDLAASGRVRVGGGACLDPSTPLAPVGVPALLDKQSGHDRGGIRIQGRASDPGLSREPSHVDDHPRLLTCHVLEPSPAPVREQRPCRARVLGPTLEEAPGIGPVPEAGADLVCEDARREVVDVCGPYHVAGVREKAGASGLARSEAVYGHVEEDLRACDDLSLEVTAVLARVFAGGEVPGYGVHAQAETFYACGVEGGRAREEKESVYHVWKGSGDHGAMRGTARGEMQGNGHVEMGGPFLSLALCRKDHPRHVLWLHAG